MTRSQEIAANLAAVHERIAKACDAVGRDAKEITLIAVTKTWPASDIAILADLGVTDVGESKEQEGHDKADLLADRHLTWHFIGQVQRNKAKKIATWANVIHSVDRMELIPLLDHREVLIQINLDPSREGRGGVEPDQAMALADAVAASALTLKGVMAVAPLQGAADLAFERLQQLHVRILKDHPQARWLSAGMSADMESAIAHGATHVRLGTSILGSR